MSKTNGRMHVVALQSTIGALEADKLALSQALAELGYCHDQQTAFITASMSGPDGAISKDILLTEAKAALAEAVETNKQLTEELEYQAHRYTLLNERNGHQGRTISRCQDDIDGMRNKQHWLTVALIATSTILAIGAAYHLPFLF